MAEEKKGENNQEQPKVNPTTKCLDFLKEEKMPVCSCGMMQASLYCDQKNKC